MWHAACRLGVRPSHRTLIQLRMQPLFRHHDGRRGCAGHRRSRQTAVLLPMARGVRGHLNWFCSLFRWDGAACAVCRMSNHPTERCYRINRVDRARLWPWHREQHSSLVAAALRADCCAFGQQNMSNSRCT